MLNKRYGFGLIVCFDILLIGVSGYVFYKIYKTTLNGNTLGVSTIRVDKKNLIFPKTNGLAYYYEPKPNSSLELTEPTSQTKSIASINSDGINSPHEYSTDKPNDTFRIVTIGDSFTFGLFVNTNDSWPMLLENYLNRRLSCTGYKKFEVINLGEEGYDFRYMIQRYISKGYKYKPDVIIFLDNGWLMWRENELSTPFYNQCYADFEQNNPGKSITNDIINRCHDKFSQEWQQTYTDAQRLDQQRTIWDNFFRYLNKGYFLYISYDMSREDIARTKLIINQRAYYSDSIQGYNNQELSFKDGHPNARGHQIIAQHVFDDVKKYFLGSCMQTSK